MVIAGAADVPAKEKAANTETIGEVMAQLGTAKESRMAAMEAADDEQRKADAATAATAAKLYAGIERGDANSGDYGEGDNANKIVMTIAGDTVNVNLSEDKKTTVADHHGWEGKRYTAAPVNGGTYEAVVFSNVGDAEMGKKFGGAAADNEFEYMLTEGELTITGNVAAPASRVASSSFDHSAGVKEFKKGDNAVAVMISGSYHGVAGTYSCTPGTDNTCAAQVAAEGFDLGGVNDDNAFDAERAAWTFKPSNPDALVVNVADDMYASYGWWLHKSADGKTFTTAVFVDDKGPVPPAADIGKLQGTATYMGGAAGKYALSSSTGGTNDAGHFTARAMLEANFNDDMITGTIDNFMGADDESRDWSVELMEQGIGVTGTILGDDGSSGDAKMTKWTIGEDAADAAGRWTGVSQGQRRRRRSESRERNVLLDVRYGRQHVWRLRCHQAVACEYRERVVLPPSPSCSHPQLGLSRTRWGFSLDTHDPTSVIRSRGVSSGHTRLGR